MTTNLLGPSLAQKEKYANAEIGFHVAFFDALEAMGVDPLMVLADEVPSSTAVEEHIWAGDLPSFQEWTDERAEANLTAFKIRIANKSWSNGVKIKREEIEDDKLAFVMRRINGLAQKASRHRGDLLVKSLLNGFSGSAYPETGDGLAYDGVLFFSTAHTAEGGPNQSNKMTTALSESALETAEQMLGDLKTHDGKDPLDMNGTHLIVGKKLEATARRLVEAGIVINTGGTASGSNIHVGQYQVVVSPRLTGTYDDYWFLADLSKPIKPMVFQDREAISTAAMVDWSTPNMYERGLMRFGAQARYNVGLYAWQTIIGSLV